MGTIYLNKFWQSRIRFNWILGLMLIIAVGVPRFIVVMQAYVSGSFYYIFLIFLALWILPFLFLSKPGRRSIGFKKPQKPLWLIYAFLTGIIISLLVYAIGVWLFDDTVSNWFVYISRSNGASGEIDSSSRLIFFLISAIMSMTFSPIGEEIFYRGLIHETFSVNLGETKASYIDSLAFALTHLAHFGIVYDNQSWRFLVIPSLLWVTFMFITSRVFFFFKQKTGSILGAILCHSGFNLAMMYCIFYFIL